MTVTEASNDLTHSLSGIYGQREAENIADWVIENITGKKRWQRRTEHIPLTSEESTLYNQYKSELLTHKPIQYVLNEAFFFGWRFILNENVLIPRPETEELVQLIVTENTKKKNISILDIGTGSGCIPISLKKKLPDAVVHSIDISEEAIGTATQNATNLHAVVSFKALDFLNENNWDLLPKFDVIVSNPPYIPSSEKQILDKNVVDFEPGVALFVPDDDPFIFYRKIEKLCHTRLKSQGKVYLEVHENYARSVLDIFIQNGWQAIIIKDMYGKERMVKIENITE